MDRLVDWMDQAVLILLIGDPLRQDVDPRVANLRSTGIRTASAVLDAMNPDAPAEVRESIKRALRGGRSGSRGLTPETLASLIRREPAMRRVLGWRSSELAIVGAPCATIAIPEALSSVAHVPPPAGGPDDNPLAA